MMMHSPALPKEKKKEKNPTSNNTNFGLQFAIWYCISKYITSISLATPQKIQSDAANSTFCMKMIIA